jgi:acylglycerol lipase
MITEVKQIHTRDGQKLHCQVVENGSPTWLVVTHGLGEHGNRHKYFFELFSQYFNILIYDLRGHGLSTGKKGYCDDFMEFVDDLGEVIQFLQKEYKMNRYILFGHSMGALVTSGYMQKKAEFELYPERVFLSAPPVAAPGFLGDMFNMAPFGITKALANLPFTIPLQGILDIEKVSHDRKVYEDYISDELNTLKVHSRLFLKLIHFSKEVFAKPLRVNCDLFVAIGTADALVHPKALIKYFQNVEKNANLKIIEGAYHEMHLEVDKYKKPYMEFLKEALMGSLQA